MATLSPHDGGGHDVLQHPHRLARPKSRTSPTMPSSRETPLPAVAFANSTNWRGVACMGNREVRHQQVVASLPATPALAAPRRAGRAAVSGWPVPDGVGEPDHGRIRRTRLCEPAPQIRRGGRGSAARRCRPRASTWRETPGRRRAARRARWPVFAVLSWTRMMSRASRSNSSRSASGLPPTGVSAHASCMLPSRPSLLRD